jgi:hypothetical protein
LLGYPGPQFGEAFAQSRIMRGTGQCARANDEVDRRQLAAMMPE